MSEAGQIDYPNKTVKQGSLTYLINEEEKTASIIQCDNFINTLLIPRSINHESKEYIIVSILERSFENLTVKSIQFADDSQIQYFGQYSFSNCSIKSIKIPSQVTHIGNHAFYNCKELITVEFPEDSKLDIIDHHAFMYTSIETIKIPSQVTTIKSYPFQDCKFLTKIEIPEKSKLHSIERGLLYGTKITKFTILSQITELKEGWNEFSDELRTIEVSPSNPYFKTIENGKILIGKSKLEQPNYDLLLFCDRRIKKYTIPNFIEHICPYSFERCYSLKEIEFPNDSKVKIIDNYSFSFTSIKTIKIPSQVIRINKKAFYLCHYFEQIEIPIDSNLQIIEEDAFSSTKLSQIFIPSKLTELKNGWNNTLSSLNISISPLNPNFKFIENGQIIIGRSNSNSIDFDCIIYCSKEIEYVTIPNYIQIIHSNAFSNCDKIKKIEIPADSKLKVIGDSAFYGSSIDTFNFTKEIIKIDNNAFNSKLEIFGDSAFSNSSIETIKIPSNVSKIGSLAFANCQNLETVIFTENSKLKIIGDGAFFKSNIKKISIPSSVTEIEYNAFTKCRSLKTIEFSEDSQIRSIGNYAFDKTQIENFTIPSHVNEIKEGCISGFVNVNVNPLNPYFKEFDDGKIIIGKSSPSSDLFDSLVFCNRNIRKIKIPDFIKIIYPFAFAYSEIRSIKIPSKVTKIGHDSFYGCRHLEKIKFQKDSKIKIIENNLFLGSSLINIKIPKEVTTIKYRSFFNCPKLKSVIFEDDSNLQTIEINAFAHTKIKSLCITSKNLYNIADKAFDTLDLAIIEIAGIQDLDSIIKNCSNFTNFVLMTPQLKENY